MYYDSYALRELLNAALKAFSKETSFNDFLKSNRKLYEYWNTVQQHELKTAAQQLARKKSLEKARIARLAKQAAKAEIMKKLTPEEIAAFKLK